MIKLLKKLSHATLAAFIALTGVFAAACVDPVDPDPPKDYGDPAKDGYIITALYPDGRPVKAEDMGDYRLFVIILTDDEGNEINDDMSGTPDAYGTAHTGVKVPGEYWITLPNIPTGYDYTPVKTSPDKAKQTITLTYKQYEYEINVTAPNGEENGYSPANGYDVKLMDGENTVASGKTDANGKFTSPAVNAGEYTVKIDAPEDKFHRHKPIKTTRDGSAVTVKMFEPYVIELNDENAMDETTLEKWVSILNSDMLQRLPVNGEHHIFSGTTYGEDETFFMLRANKKGRYTVNFIRDENEQGLLYNSHGYLFDTNNVYDRDGTLFDLTDYTRKGDYYVNSNGERLKNNKGEDVKYEQLTKQSYGNYITRFYLLDADGNQTYGTEDASVRLDGESNSGNQCRELSMVEGAEYVFSISSKDKKRDKYTLPFSISYSKEPATQSATGTGSYVLAYDNINEAVLNFKPTMQGTYRITATGDYDTKLIAYSNATDTPLTATDSNKFTTTDVNGNLVIGDDNGGADGKNFSYEENVPIYYVGNTFVYHIFVPNNISTSIGVKIERIGDSTPIFVEKETKVISAPDNLTKQSKPSGDWNWLPYDGSVSAPEKKDDGWFVTVDGVERKVYVAITKNFAGLEYSFSTVEYMGMGSIGPKPEDKPEGTPDGDGDIGLQPDKQNTYLTVWDGEPAVNNKVTYYDFSKYVEQYAKFVNDDGTYEYNASLETFVKMYMNTHWANHFMSADPNNPPKAVYMLACGYYA